MATTRTPGRWARTREGLRRRPAWRRFLRRSARIGIVLVIGIPLFAVAAGASGVRLLLFGDLPGTVPKENPVQVAIPAKILDADGSQIGEFRQFDLSVPITPDDIPQVLKDALVASEDRTFWTHQGVDLEGISRAAVANYNQGETIQGGSTITQQFVREKYLNNDHTVERKLNEILLATRVERDMTEQLGSSQAAKEEIMFEYLNTTYFGGGAYGVGAAAQTYFRKNVKDLSLSEAAMIVAMIPAPSKYDPRVDPAAADRRRLDVLRQMRDLSEAKEGSTSADASDTGFANAADAQRDVGDLYKGVTEAQYETAAGQHMWWSGFGWPDRPATIFWPPPTTGQATYPYFVDYVRQYLLEKYGPEKVYRGGMTVQTTIDPKLQQLAEQSVNQGLNGTKSPLEMSLVSVEPSTGFVKALVGGRDFNASQVNLALGGSSGMQPGSSFKGYTIATALENGYGPDTVFNAGGTFTLPNCSGPGCTVKGEALGPVAMRGATSASSNTYFVQLILAVGPQKVAALANRVGVTRIDPNKTYGMSLTLGAYEVSPLDMAAGYSVFANHGVKADATPIMKVTMADGTVLEDNTGPRGTRVLEASVADWTTDILTSVLEPGATGERAPIGRPAAGKTGTAEDEKAAWFVGYTPQLTTAVWMGYSDAPRSLLNIGGFGQIFGGTIPAITWQKYMSGAMAGLPVIPFAVPGILPQPTSGIRTADKDVFPGIVRDCGGPCVDLPTLTTPPTTAPPPPGDTTTAPTTTPPDTSDSEATTSSTAPRGIGQTR
jgi:penicillin-binding protein 1A